MNEDILNYLRDKMFEYHKAENLDFRELVKHDDNFRGKKGVLEYPGAYVIFEGDEPIYVGSAGGGTHVLKYRMGDLFFFTEKSRFHHTLTKKLITHKVYRRFRTINEVRDFYLEKCSIKVVKTDTVEEARFIEAALILFLEPSYNYG